MFYMNENILDDSRALISIQHTKHDINLLNKSGMINYASSDNTLWLTVPDVRRNILKSGHDKLHKVITAKDGSIVLGSYEFVDEQTFKNNVTIEKNLLVRGNLSVLGETTNIDTPSLTIEDNIIELNKNEDGNGITLVKSGTALNRGTFGFARYLFDENEKGFILDVADNIDGDRRSWTIIAHTEDSGSYKAGDVRIKNKLIAPFVNVTDSLNVSNSTTTKNLTVSTLATLNGTATINAATTVAGTLNVTGASTFRNTVTFYNPIIAKNTATFEKAVTLKDILSVDKKITAKDSIDITGGALNVLEGNGVFHKSVEIKEDLTLRGNQSVEGNSTVAGNINCSRLIKGQNIQTLNDFIVSSGNGKGIKFWESDNYKIFVNENNCNVSGTEQSDYNMYFRTIGGTNRSFVFANGNTALAQIEANGKMHVKDNIYSKESLVLTKAMEGEGNGIDADTVDGKHSRDLVLRDGTNKMLGDLNIASHKIIWETGNEISFAKNVTLNNIARKGMFTFASENNVNLTAIHVGAIKLKDMIIDSSDCSISNIEKVSSKYGEVLKLTQNNILFNAGNSFNTINVNNATIETLAGIKVGQDGSVLKANGSEFKYKNKEVITTAGTHVMYGDINMANRKLRFSSNTTGTGADNSFAEVSSEAGASRTLIIKVAGSDNDKVLVNINNKEAIRVEKNKTVFSDNPYHNGYRILTMNDVGPNKNLDADKLDGKHYSDLVEEFVNVKGDSMNGNLNMENSSKVTFGSNNSYINKASTLNIVSDEDIKLTSGMSEVVLSRNGEILINGDKVLTVADEGHENRLDADMVDGIHASQFVRRDECTEMAADINLNGNKIISEDMSMYQENGITKIKNGNTEILLKKTGSEKGLEINSDSANILKAFKDLFVYKGNTIWHSGNFERDSYEKIAYEVIDGVCDVSSLLNNGKYICKSFSDVNSIINPIGGYVEVIRYNADNILQKIYSMCGNYVLIRAIYNGQLNNFKVVAAKQTFDQDVNLLSWNLENEMYYTDVTHDLLYSGIASVTLTDSDGFSMATGFKIINDTTIRIYSASKIAGKAVINTSLN